MALVVLGMTPLLAALLVPAAQAWRDAGGGGGPRRAWLWAAVPGAGAAALAAVAAALAVPPDAPAGMTAAGAAGGAAGVVAGFSALAAALYAAARLAGGPPAAGQSLAAAVAVLLLGAPFFMNPVIEGAGPSARVFWVGATAAASPAFVLAHAAAGIDPFRAPLLYDLSVCQYYAYAYPSPWALAAAYAALAGLLGGAVEVLRRLRPRPTEYCTKASEGV